MECARIHIKAGVMAIAMAMLAFPSAQAASTTCAAYNDPSNPQLATCNSASGSSKLFQAGSTGDHVTIFAPELNDPTNINSGSSYKTCHTIINSPPLVNGVPTPNNTYFIPWSTPREWSAFLTAVGAYAGQGISSTDAGMSSVVTTSGCCIPMQLTQVYCPQSGANVNLVSPLVLGGRTVGTPLTNGVPDAAVQNMVFDEAAATSPIPNYGINNWGAMNDTTQSATVTHDQYGNPVNFEVAFACNPNLASNPAANTMPVAATAGYSGAGGWVEMSWSGSCAPADGKCATIPNNTLTSLPANTSTLCATGSVIDPTSIKATQTGWTWTCDGTGGSGCSWDPGGMCQNVTCAATNSTPLVLGSCGPEAGQFIPPASAVVTNPGLCATGTVANFDTSGTIIPGYQYTWQCVNSNGSITSPAQNNCAAHIDDGFCGTDDNANLSTLTPTDPNLCKGGKFTTLSTNFSLPGAPWSGMGDYWWWQCLNSDGSLTNSIQNTCAAYQGAANPGVCANLNVGGVTYTAVQMALLASQCDLTPTACQLCTQGIYEDGSLASTGGGMYWSWACKGTNGGGDAACTHDAMNPNFNGSCGTDVNQVFGSMTPGPVNLCKTVNGVSETPSYNPATWFNGTTNTWTWQCLGGGTGTAITCQAYYNPAFVTPVCGTAAGLQAYATPYTYLSPPPTSTLCQAGTPSTPLVYHFPASYADSWTWTCTGTNASNPLTCYTNVYAPPPGKCGTTSDTCAIGTPTSLNCVGTTCTWTCTYPLGLYNDPLGDPSGTCTTLTASPGVCGTSSGACTVGTLVGSPSCNSANPPTCSWQCQGDVGTTATSCSGTGTSPTLDPNGACGLANGLPTYTIPNQNLCNTGTLMQPPGVQGSGPWTWTCEGSQSNSNLCSASICAQCSGNPTRTNTISGIFDFNATVNGCALQTATATWTEADDLVPSSSTVTGTISGATQFGPFSFQVPAASPPTHTPSYCSPCYIELNKTNSGDGISNFVITAYGKDGSGNACSVNVPATGVGLQ